MSNLPAARPEADRNLLFGVLALQLDFITRDALVAAMNAWVLDKARPLGQILVERGALGGDHHQLLETLVRKHLEAHGGDPHKSLASVSSLGTVREELRSITDPDLHASLAGVPADPFATGASAADPDLHATFATGGVPADPFATGAPAPGKAPLLGTPTFSGLRYRVLRSHAKGGLGEVFVALDRELGREVALKEIQGRHADHPDSRARFLLEAEITGGLEHPGIVPVYGLGTYPDGRPYYAMRFIRGESLREAIERFHKADQAGRDPGERTLELRQLLGRFVAVCNAVAYAHSRGVLHRDIKPANVMLGPYGETLVVDWGLAKPVGRKEAAASGSVEETLWPASASRSAATQAGSALGTPSFMSPEQAAGRLDVLGPASDVYSLGATLYCLLTGKAPFEGDDVGTILQRVQRGDFPPPRQLKAGLPAGLEAVCLKAMALRPEDRYSSAQALADEVEHWLADEPVSAYPEPWRLRLRRWGRRHRTVVTAAAALCLTALVALSVGYVLLAREQGRTHKAQHDRALAQVDALLNATPQAVPTILDDLAPVRPQVLPRLRELRTDANLPERQRTRAGLALLAVDPGQVDYLRGRLLAADNDPEEMLLLRERLLPHRDVLAPGLWAEADGDETAPERRFRALVALARFDPDNSRWAGAGARAVDPLLAADLLRVGTWAEVLAPVRSSLLGPLSRAFRDTARVAERHVAARILADYAADQPGLLADLLVSADVRTFATLLPALRAHGPRAADLLREELARKPRPIWADANASAWQAPAPGLVGEIEGADGMVAERFALCQTLAPDRFGPVAEGLRRAGYRPIRLRPYRHGQAVRVSAVWARDGRDWRTALGLTAAELRERNARLQAQGYVPVDVAGFEAGGGEGTREHHAALWARPVGAEEEARLSVAIPGPEVGAVRSALAKEGLVPVTLQATRGTDGRPRFHGVWWKSPRAPGQWVAGLDESRPDYEGRLHDLSVVQIDVDLRPGAAGDGSWRYSALWHPAAGLESVESHGLAPARHLERCRELAAQGYRPETLAVAAGADGRAPVTASVWHRPAVTDRARDDLASRQANAAAALLLLGEERGVWELFRHSPDPRLRTYLLHRLSPLGVDPRAVLRRLETEKDVSARQALVLSLGTFTARQLPPDLWRPLVPGLLDWYRNDPDPGLHGAVDWLLRQRRQGDVPRAVDWGQADALRKIDRELAGPSPVDGRRWYVNKSGQTLAVVPGPVQFLMGSPGHTPQRRLDEPLHRRRIGRTFAIATKVVTVEQFRKFLKAHPEVRHSYPREVGPDPDCPILAINWYIAAQYCRWLSEQEGVPEDQMCYPPVAALEKGKDGKAPLPLPADYLSRTGYRLPTEAEWECACRAGTETSRHYGGPEDMLTHYAWYAYNSKDRAWPVGQKMPNDLGLFDMQGNVWQWCQSEYRDYPTGPGARPAEDREDGLQVRDITSRVLRGGTFFLHASSLRSAFRLYDRPTYNFMTFSFRVARTCP